MLHPESIPPASSAYRWGGPQSWQLGDCVPHDHQGDETGGGVESGGGRGEARSPARSTHEILLDDPTPPPAPILVEENEWLGDVEVHINRYTSREFHELEMEHLWPRVWQMAGRTSDLPEVGDHFLYEIGDRSLIVVSVLAAIGNEEELSLHTEVGLNHGLTRTEIEEILLHIAVYAGFPMAMQASRQVDGRFRMLDGVDRLPERQPSAFVDDVDRQAAACDVRRTLTAGRANPDPDADFEAFVDRLGEVGRVAYRWAFGDVWSRDELSRRDRSMVVVAILTALSRVDELAFHVPAALNHGLSRVEIEEIMVQMTIYGGVPRAIEGTLAMQEAFAKIDAREASA